MRPNVASRRTTRTALPVARAVVPVIIAVLVAVLVAPAGPAGAARGLTATTTLAASGTSVVLGADAAGNAAAAWVSGGQVQVSQRLAGAPAWTPAATVSVAGVTASDPDISVGADGTVAVVWLGASAGAAPHVEIAVRPARQAWVGARRVSDNENWTDRDPQVEAGPGGVATVVWAATRADGASIVRAKTANATSVSAQTALLPAAVPGTVFSGLSLARNAAGDSVAAWRSEGVGGTVQVARRLAGQPWSAAATVDTGLVPDATSAAVDGSGTATLGWSSGASEGAATPATASWPRGQGAPGARVGLSVAPGRQVQVAAAAGGAVAATWNSPTGLWFAQGAAVQPLTSTPVSTHALALSDAGTASVAYAPPGSGLVLVHRPAGGAWATTPVPSAAGSVPALVGHGGEATLAWAEGGSGPVQALTLDNGAPTAVHLTAPLRDFNHGKRIVVGWIGADSWSPIRYEVQRQVATYRGPFDPADTWLTTTATAGVYAAGAGRTVCFRVRGSDTAGNVSPWSVQRCATTAVNDGALKERKLAGRSPWRTVKKAKGAYSGDLTTSTRRGATLSLPVSARRVALLVSTGRGHGSVSVSLGRDRLGTYSLASAPAASQVVVPVAVFSRARQGRLKIQVTSRGKPVRIDGVYAGR